MEYRKPHVSVIIPAYNQGNFLEYAIQSVLSQTYSNYEIIVVDDGSTDDTSTIAKLYGDKIHYYFQENKGLAGARNTGIRNARGIYIALLDCDDQWLPDFLLKMVSLAEQNPDASVFYCNVNYMDAEGHTLPQIPDVKLVSPDKMYETLVRANFIFANTIFMLRSAVLTAGLFDESFRACEDWDLWLRLSPTHQFVGINDCLVRYRLHGSSLSADPSKMQQAVKSVIEKHFGPDDGNSKNWSDIKKIAYGGVYRYCAWTSVMRQNNWDASAQSLSKALMVDPESCDELGIFYNLAMGSQPIGYHGTPYQLDLQSNARQIDQMLLKVFE